MDDLQRHLGTDDIVVPGKPFNQLSDNLRCSWENSSQGRCDIEVDFIVTFGPPPCGHEWRGGQIARFCGRHMMRAFFMLLTKQRCGTCGSEYQGLALLRSVQRL